MQKEIWKDILDYEGIYQVSNFGGLKSIRNGVDRVLKPVKLKNGYLKCSLSKKGVCKQIYIHQLVAMAFLDHKPNGFEYVVNHKNFDKLDNNASNLEVVTNRENSNKKHIKGSSKYVGVTWCKYAKRWKAQYVLNGKSRHIGNFIDEQEAGMAYKKTISEL